MNYYKDYSEKIIPIIKDILIIILIVIPFVFIGIRTALFVAAICTSILLMRRAIRQLNPGHIDGYRILHEGSELPVPQGVEIFELSNSATMEILYKYIGVLRAMAIHPRILIIRFNQISQIDPIEAHVLDDVIKKLSENEIIVFFSDIDTNIENQLKKYNLRQKVGRQNIFYKITDALKCAEKNNVH